MKGDCWLCQPAGTRICVQTGRRLGVTSGVDVETNVFRPVHVSVERRITRLTHVQATFDTLTLVFSISTADATRLTRVPLRHLYDIDALDLRLVGENLGEAVERPPVQVEIAVFPPVLRVTILVLTDTSEFADVDSTHAPLNTLFNNVLR